MRQRAQIVLLAAADGLATRAIARRVGWTIGTASKLRVRYAAHRLAGLDETGDRGAMPKYAAETGRRILTVLEDKLSEQATRTTIISARSIRKDESLDRLAEQINVAQFVGFKLARRHPQQTFSRILDETPNTHFKNTKHAAEVFY